MFLTWSVVQVFLTVHVLELNGEFPCPDVPGWFRCPDHSTCISPNQLCDGRIDCLDSGWDERNSICFNRTCEIGVRCAQDPICIAIPHRFVCNGHRQPRCSDGSDMKNCAHKIYTGCFVHHPYLGLKLSNCTDCLCNLKDPKDDESRNNAWIYRSIGHTSRDSHVAGNVCLSADDERVCDGVQDCVNGVDEAVVLCQGRIKTSTANLTSRNNFVNNLLLFGGVFSIVLYCLGCILVHQGKKSAKRAQENRSRNNDPPPDETLPIFNRSIPIKDLEENWSWNRARLVREVGRGFFSTVYLAEELSGRLVAVKSRDDQDQEMIDYFQNEIQILKGLGRHLHIIKMVGYSLNKHLVAFEYCQNGSLKKYLETNRSYFIDEIDPVYGEIGVHFAVQRSVSVYGGGNLPMSDFLTSLHTKLEPDTTSICSPTDTRHLLNTRRLLRWTRQITKGLIFLRDNHVVHGDIALRNILLTFSDIVKISDFGLSFVCQEERQRKSQPHWGKKPLPLAWLAPECIKNPDALSPESDIWAFGITLWELFTLGQEPYRDLIDLEKLESWLDQGNRLITPSFAPKTLQSIMLDCWHANPICRPGLVTIMDALNSQQGHHHHQASSCPRTLRYRTDSGLGTSRSSEERFVNHRFSLGYVHMNGSSESASQRAESVVTNPQEMNGNSFLYWHGYKIINGT